MKIYPITFTIQIQKFKMTPMEIRILKANRKIQILDKIHQLHMELFQLESDEILAEHRALTEFITMEQGLDEFILEDPPSIKEKKHKKPPAPKCKGIKRKICNRTKFGSIVVD